MFDSLFSLIRELYPNRNPILLHEPVFKGREKALLAETIDSTLVSSVGPHVVKFEEEIAKFTGAKYAIAAVNGTSALHMALILAGVEDGTEVLTQALTFVATANAIHYCRAHPILVDSERESLGMCPDKLEQFFKMETRRGPDGFCYNKTTGRKIAACVPMHVVGHPVQIDRIMEICQTHGVEVVEDAAESLGSYTHGRHTGTIARLSALSFNGNKIITTGGGGMILTSDPILAARAKHLTTTAKQPHKWDFYHDEVGYNYRLPNLNSALGLAQMEQLPLFIKSKRETADQYRAFCQKHGLEFADQPPQTQSNFWLCSILLKNKSERDQFLSAAHESGILVRPVWNLMSELPAFKKCQATNLDVANDIRERMVNLPSSVRI